MDESSDTSRIHVYFLLGAMMSICGLTPLLLYLYGFERPLLLVAIFGLGIILLIVGLILKRKEFLDEI